MAPHLQLARERSARDCRAGWGADDLKSDMGEARNGRERLLVTLERLLAIPALDLPAALGEAALRVAESLSAEKVDAFLYDPAINSLVARGTSDTPLGRRQKALGLDRLPLVNGGRCVIVFETGQPFRTGHADADPEELVGVIEGLGIRSTLAVPLRVADERRGVLLASSTTPEFFSEDDLRLLDAVAGWVGLVAHRAELVARVAQDTAGRARRVAAEELITILAHDFRNHLVPLKGRLDLIRRRASRESREPDRRDAEEALRAVERLQQLIANLLDVARLEQGAFTLELQPVDLVAIMREVADRFRVGSTEIEVEAPTEVVGTVDAGRIRQALENLVANAVRYAPIGTPVILKVDCSDREDGPWATISVIDRGPGIPPSLLPSLFERFAAGPGSTGLGLGLHLVRQIARAHQGDLTVESIPGRTHFQLSVPLEPREF